MTAYADKGYIMKTVIYTQDSNPAVYCADHADAAVAELAAGGISYSAEPEATNSECVKCAQLASAAAIAAALASLIE